MSEESDQNQLSPQIVDYVTAATKAIVGAAPFAGSLLVELAGAIIPNQRMDRIAKFAMVLEEKISKLEQDFVRLQLTNENFTDLLEEGMRQAARSLTDGRREYIANLIANSLSEKDVEFIDTKHLLRMLSEINNIEVIWLRLFLVPTFGGDEKFSEKHADVIKPIATTFGDPQPVYEKEILQNNYKEHLTQLGLLVNEYDLDLKTKGLKVDTFTQAPMKRGYQLSPLGKLLLRYIGFFKPIKLD
jgi:hypothetical protein